MIVVFVTSAGSGGSGEWKGVLSTLADEISSGMAAPSQDQGKVDEPQPSEEGGGLSRIRGMARKKKAELTANAEQVSSSEPSVAIVKS